MKKQKILFPVNLEFSYVWSGFLLTVSIAELEGWEDQVHKPCSAEVDRGRLERKQTSMPVDSAILEQFVTKDFE